MILKHTNEYTRALRPYKNIYTGTGTGTGTGTHSTSLSTISMVNRLEDIVAVVFRQTFRRKIEGVVEYYYIVHLLCFFCFYLRHFNKKILCILIIRYSPLLFFSVLFFFLPSPFYFHDIWHWGIFIGTRLFNECV